MKLTIFQIVLLGVILLLALFSWYWLYQILYLNKIILPSLSFLPLISLLLILWLSSQYFLEIFLSAVLVLGSFFLIFPFQQNILISIAVAFIFLIWAAKKVKRERNQQLKISLKFILKNAAFWSLTAFFIVISMAFHFSPKNSLEINLPLRYFDHLEPVLKKNVPGYHPNLSFEEIFLTYQLSQLNQKQQQVFLATLAQSPDTLKFLKSEDISFDKVLNEEKFFPIFKKVLFQTNPEIKKMESEFIETYNILENTLNQNWKNFLQANLNNWLLNLPPNWQNYLKIGLSGSLFLSFWALTSIFSTLLVLFSWLIFKLLIAVKLLEIKKEPTEKEILEIK